MKPRIMVALMGMLALAAPIAWAEDIEIERTVAPDATVEISNVAGEVVINGWDRDAVRLKGKLGKNQEVRVHESSSGIRFEIRNIRGNDNYDEAELTLEVPAAASVVATGVSSDFLISGLRGQSIMAESVSGDVQVDAEVARVELTSVSGDIEFAGGAGRGSFETVSGDIDATGMTGEVSIRTVSGDGRLVAGLLERGRFETVSGALELKLSLAAGGRLTAEAMSGDVLLTVPSNQEGEFDVQTFSGDIRSAFGKAVEASFGPGSRLKHEAGGSGASFRIENFSGDVRIETD